MSAAPAISPPPPEAPSTSNNHNVPLHAVANDEQVTSKITFKAVHNSLSDALMSSMSNNSLPANAYHRPSPSRYAGTKRPGSWVLTKVSIFTESIGVQDEKGNNEVENEEEIVRLFVVNRLGQILPSFSYTSSEPPYAKLTDASLCVRNMNTRFVRGNVESSSRPDIRPNSHGEDARMNDGEPKVTAVSDGAQMSVHDGCNSSAIDLDNPGHSLELKAKKSLPRRGWIFAALDENLHSKKTHAPSELLSSFPTLPCIHRGCFLPNEKTPKTEGLINGLNPDSLADHDSIEFGFDVDLSGDMKPSPNEDVSSQVEIAVLDDRDSGEDDETVSDADLPIDELLDDDIEEEQKVSGPSSVSIPPAVPSELTEPEYRHSPRKYTPVTLANIPRRNTARTAAAARASTTKPNATDVNVTIAPAQKRRASLAKAVVPKGFEQQEIKNSATTLATGTDYNNSFHGTRKPSKKVKQPGSKKAGKAYIEPATSKSESASASAKKPSIRTTPSRVKSNTKKDTTGGGTAPIPQPPFSGSTSSTVNSALTNQPSGSTTSNLPVPDVPAHPIGSYSPYSPFQITAIPPPTLVVPRAHQPTIGYAMPSIQMIWDSAPVIQALPLQLQSYLFTALATGTGHLPPVINPQAIQAGIGIMGNPGASQNPAGNESGFGKPGPLLAQSSTSAAPALASSAKLSSSNNGIPYSVPSSTPMSIPHVSSHQHSFSVNPTPISVPFTSTASLQTYGPGSTIENQASILNPQVATPAAVQSQKNKKGAQKDASKEKNVSPTVSRIMNGSGSSDVELVLVKPQRRNEENTNKDKKSENSEALDGKVSGSVSSLLDLQTTPGAYTLDMMR
ncbi:hypothetical protein DFH05DRAFT_1498500 [Lentinula detonsa]|uniref:Uncharacterized protein n=1 Tax=Lentinula detonsa TaxID=2804962 RepID=A0A9W8TW29_9AGAR|nr:hypothetical protein DFH05DRAFT_1498500 [Lentinula detonsa]